MIEVEDKKVKSFLENLRELYTFFEEFCRKHNLRYRYSKFEIYEEFAGKYKVEELYVYRNGDFLFKLKPVGAYIIAADGRVDLIGKFEEKRLIFLAESYFYEGFEGEGWYVSLKGKQVRRLEEKVLCQLLEEVSEFKCVGGYKEKI